MFSKVSNFFTGLMNKTQKQPNCLKIVRNQQINVLEQLKANNEALDQIQKSLENYMELKRKAFPRFYFLSNDELIDILANSKNLEIVQQHLKTCFDNIVKLEIADSEAVEAMFSSEGEKVPLTKKPAKARGQIEQWLEHLQQSMIENLRHLMKQAVADYSQQDRKVFVTSHFGQIVASLAQIMWCQQSEVFISEQSSNPFSLQEWFDVNVN
mmetsp:Transcript_20685/g.31665  ORF Transcript_20685/g.31665 Transcript_20685/m.31665 type:complete len:211 (+) Transcript_20685:86-718(+)